MKQGRVGRRRRFPFLRHATVVLTMAVALLSGCASRIHIRKNPRADEVIPDIGRIAVVTDVTIAVDAWKDYYCVSLSQCFSHHLGEAAAAVLLDKGYHAPVAQAPYVGGSMPPEKAYPVGEPGSGEPIENMHAPFSVEHSDSDEKEFGQSFRKVPRAVFVKARAGRRKDFVLADAGDSLMPHMLSMKERLHSRYAFFVISRGTTVSPGKSAAEGVAAGGLTTIATGGMVTGVAYSVSSTRSFAALVDLENAEVTYG
jgi:hypothetical protein